MSWRRNFDGGACVVKDEEREKLMWPKADSGREFRKKERKKEKKREGKRFRVS